MLSGSNFPIALLLTLLAGLSTGLGGVIVLLTKKFSTKTLSLALGFSAGVMLFISLTDLFTEARTGLGAHFGDRMGLLYTVLAFSSPRRRIRTNIPQLRLRTVFPTGTPPD